MNGYRHLHYFRCAKMMYKRALLRPLLLLEFYGRSDLIRSCKKPLEIWRLKIARILTANCPIFYFLGPCTIIFIGLVVPYNINVMHHRNRTQLRQWRNLNRECVTEYIRQKLNQPSNEWVALVNQNLFFLAAAALYSIYLHREGDAKTKFVIRCSR